MIELKERDVNGVTMMTGCSIRLPKVAVELAMKLISEEEVKRQFQNRQVPGSHPGITASYNHLLEALLRRWSGTYQYYHRLSRAGGKDMGLEQIQVEAESVSKNGRGFVETLTSLPPLVGSNSIGNLRHRLTNGLETIAEFQQRPVEACCGFQAFIHHFMLGNNLSHYSPEIVGVIDALVKSVFPIHTSRHHRFEINLVSTRHLTEKAYEKKVGEWDKEVAESGVYSYYPWHVWANKQEVENRFLFKNENSGNTIIHLIGKIKY